MIEDTYIRRGRPVNGECWLAGSRVKKKKKMKPLKTSYELYCIYNM